MLRLYLFSAWVLVEARPSASCLGVPDDCYSFLPYAPRGADYESVEDIPDADLIRFFSDPDVCTVDKLFLLHPVLDIRTLAGLQGGPEQAKFDGAGEQITAFLAWCRWTQVFITALTDMPEGITFTSQTEHSDAVPSDFRIFAQELMNDYYPQAGLMFEEFPRGNNSVDEQYPRSIASLITEYTMKIMQIAEPADPASYTDALALALRLSLVLRQAVENFRMVLGVKTTIKEITQIHPYLGDKVDLLPRITFHSEIYGRHWDVIEALIASRNVDYVVEIGVALGAVGLVSLDRFTNMRYLGIDPYIKAETRAIFLDYAARAVLVESTSSEVAKDVPDRTAGLVFIDGPHTYAQVSTDITEWISKVRPGGWLAGHDFSAQHPPLVWAVLEQALVRGIKDIHVGMDSVWWWDSAEWLAHVDAAVGL